MSTSATYGPVLTMSPGLRDEITHSTMFRLAMPCEVSSWTYTSCGSVLYAEFAGICACVVTLAISMAVAAAV
jgi:hypothetical protein